ncbi:acyl-CoA transferase [Marinobacterium sp. xm-a-152]|uniref:acyl-CoA transferase n=1 Tax=Marinobacterium sp. xm-a-152 TaxID=2497733 RepID=UPI001568BACF|nr:acyl-CoA transferase [Marinobacterium sp. xm-a-152]NRP15004.1 hypothetical protein [Marinobacterium sp. xm-a-152]
MTRREQAISALHSLLAEKLMPILVKRNEVLSTAIPNEGLLILRDGDAGEPEVLLSPLRYLYQHRIELEVWVQQAQSSERDQQFDQLLQRLGVALDSAGNLNDAVDLLHTGSPEFSTESFEGGATVKVATIPIFLEFNTRHPLA